MADKVETKPGVVFYCKDCEEIVDTRRVGIKYVFTCKKCGTKNVAFGTEKSIRNFFHLDSREKEKERVEAKATLDPGGPSEKDGEKTKV